MQRTYVIRGLFAVLTLAASVSGYAWWEKAHGVQTSLPTVQSLPVPATTANPGGLPDFSAIVSRYGPAVVNVTATSDAVTDTSADQSGNDQDDPMFKFFRHFGIPMPPDHGHGHGHGMMGMGSGFIVSPDGLILTNAHVVDGASEVDVKLTDKREFRARVVGIDKPSDVAVLRIKAGDLPTVALGDPSQIRVGEWVLAIGAPFGFENSATAGIVSAKSRSLPDEGYVPFIQTDAAVNPGNSGGPLFNLRGEVIGINSQIYTKSGGYQGVSFAIPIDLAMKVKDQIVQNGKVTRGRLGVVIQDINQSLASSFGLKHPAGALVNSVEDGSPADKAGIKPGDVILSLNGQPVDTSADLPPRVAVLKPGTEATMKVWRDNAEHQVTARVAELEQSTAIAETGSHTKGRLGLAVRPLTREERSQSHVGDGLLVVEASGPAARAGITSGDVVLAINGTPVHDVDQLRDLARKAGHHVALLVQRDNEKIFVPLDLG